MRTIHHTYNNTIKKQLSRLENKVKIHVVTLLKERLALSTRILTTDYSVIKKIRITLPERREDCVLV